MITTPRRSTLLLAVVLAGAAAIARADPPAPVPRAAFTAESLTEGVFLLRPTAPSISRTNSILVQREDGPLVIESQPSVESARELLATIATLDSRPIRYLVLSHPHVESIGGAAAFPDSTLLVASAGCARSLDDPSFDPGAELRAAAARPEEWVLPPLRRPVLVVDGPATLADSRNAVVLLPAGEAHTGGDLMVLFPRARILYVGAALVVDGNPYAPDGDLSGWLDLLHQVVRMDIDTLLPLRGPRATRDDARRFKDGLAWIRGQVETGLRDGIPWEDIPNFVLQSHSFAEYFDANAVPAFYRQLVEKVLREADEQRTKRMMPSIAPQGP